MESLPIYLPVLFFVIALFYASVGFGGGSSYLAVLALLGWSHTLIPQTALVCNLIVAGGGVWHFHRGGHLQIRKVLPFIALSIPMAYLGGRLPVGRQLFFVLLGASLLVAGARMFLPAGAAVVARELSGRKAWLVGAPIGAVLGLLSGLVGIGGGVFLAPVLILAGWTNARGAAAAAALFIIVNSGAGLVGQFSKGVFINHMVIPLALAVLLGGQIGARLGAYRLPVNVVRRLLATLIILISFRIMWSAL